MVVATGALWSGQAAGFKARERGGGGGGGGGGDMRRLLAEHVRQGVDNGVSALQLDRRTIRWESVRHLRLPRGERRGWYLDAGAPTHTLSGASSATIALADQFDLRLITEGRRQVRQTMGTQCDLGAKALLGTTHKSLLVMGAALTSVESGQEGFSLLFTTPNRQGRLHEGRIIPPDTLGMRVWVAPVGGVSTGLREEPFAVVGADVIGSKHHPVQVTALVLPDGRSLCLVHPGPILLPRIEPWVSDAVPAFSLDQR